METTYVSWSWRSCVSTHPEYLCSIVYRGHQWNSHHSSLKITYLLLLSFLGQDSRYCLAKYFSWDLSRLKSIKLLARLHSFLNFRCFFQVYVFLNRTQLLKAVDLRSLLSSLLPDLGLQLWADAYPTTTKCWQKWSPYHNLISHYANELYKALTQATYFISQQLDKVFSKCLVDNQYSALSVWLYSHCKQKICPSCVW